MLRRAALCRRCGPKVTTSQIPRRTADTSARLAGLLASQIASNRGGPEL
jgi:hypothetical protein